MTNVLLDIALLGDGFRHPQKRTGIYRVAQALAPLLAAAPGCHLTLCASHGPGAARAAATATPGLRGVPFARRPGLDTVSDWRQAAFDAVGEGDTSAALLTRPVRKAAHLLDTAVGATARPVQARALAQADVYHSLLDALPPQTQGLTRFLTVYDLIPLLLTHHFRQKNSAAHIAHFQNILDSLRPEDSVLAISQATKDDLCRMTGHDPARVFVTPLAADPALFQPVPDEAARAAARSKYGLPDAPYFLGLSTLAPHKNFDHVIRCFARTVQEQSDMNGVSLVLVGAKGWDYDAIFDAIDAAPAVRERVLLPGRVEDADLAALYSGALAFVYMSIYEGFGLPPLEAMQCGVPVITSNTSSLPEVVGEAGTTLDPADADGLCAALWNVYQDKGLRRLMAQKSLVRAREFSWERCAAQTVAAYQSALSGTPSA